jgi:hypothetical protein
MASVIRGDDNFDSAGLAPALTASTSTFPVGAHGLQFINADSANGFTNSSAHFDTIAASVSTPVRLVYGGYSYTYVNYGTWMFLARGYGTSVALVVRIA